MAAALSVLMAPSKAGGAEPRRLPAYAPEGVTLLALFCAVLGSAGLFVGAVLVSSAAQLASGLGGALAPGAADPAGTIQLLGLVFLAFSGAALALAYGLALGFRWAWPAAVGVVSVAMLLAAAAPFVSLVLPVPVFAAWLAPLALVVGGAMLWYLFTPSVREAFGRGSTPVPWERLPLPAWLKPAPSFLLLGEMAFLFALAMFMFDVRMDPFPRMASGGNFFYVGTDPYYHLRHVIVLNSNWPWTLHYDPFTQFPFGTESGQFGTLFDQLVSLLAMLWGGGTATPQSTGTVTVAFPALLGALTVFPAYYFAKRAIGIPAAITTAVIVALLPGEFLARSVAGYFDHHVAEVLFSTAALLGFVASVDAARRSKLTPAEFLSGGWRLEWPSTIVMVLGGVALTAYILVWPSGVMFVAILLAYVAFQLLIDHLRDEKSDDLALACMVFFGTAFVLLIPRVRFWGEFSSGDYTALHPAICLVAAVFPIGMAWLRERFHLRAGWQFPLAVLGGGLLLLAAAFSVPSLGGQINTGLRWLFSWAFPQVQNLLTVAEVQPADWNYMNASYGYPLAVTIFLGLPITVVGAILGKRYHLLLFIWSFVVISAGFSQVRFNYYTAMGVAVLVGLVVATVADITGLTRYLSGEKRTRKTGKKVFVAEFQWYQPFAVGLVALLLVAPAYAFPGEKGSYLPPWKFVQRFGAGDEALWTEELQWMEANTPPLGIDLATIYQRPPTTAFPYPPGTYGVLAWWDYGHWIEVVSKRPPVANPFQQQAPFASRYFTAQSEADAERLLNDYVAQAGLPPDVNPVRYVMISDEDAGGKFGAIATWAGFCYQDSRKGYYDLTHIGALYPNFAEAVRQNGLPALCERYYTATMPRLYHDDGVRMHHYRLVRENSGFTGLGTILRFDDTANVSLDVFNQVVTVRGFNEIPEPFHASYQSKEVFIQFGDPHVWGYDIRWASRLKTFERVPGAHLAGNGTGLQPGEEVQAHISLKVENTNRAFSWRGNTTVKQDGTFEIIVPYSTKEFLTPAQGGTNTMVKPSLEQCALRCNYLLRTNRGVGDLIACVDVEDQAVLRGQTIRVELKAEDCP